MQRCTTLKIFFYSWSDFGFGASSRIEFDVVFFLWYLHTGVSVICFFINFPSTSNRVQDVFPIPSARALLDFIPPSVCAYHRLAVV